MATWGSQTVAVKVIIQDEHSAQQVAAELQLSLSFNHENVVRTLACVNTEHRLILADSFSGQPDLQQLGGPLKRPLPTAGRTSAALRQLELSGGAAAPAPQHQAARVRVALPAAVLLPAPTTPSSSGTASGGGSGAAQAAVRARRLSNGRLVSNLGAGSTGPAAEPCSGAGPAPGPRAAAAAASGPSPDRQHGSQSVLSWGDASTSYINSSSSDAMPVHELLPQSSHQAAETWLVQELCSEGSLAEALLRRRCAWPGTSSCPAHQSCHGMQLFPTVSPSADGKCPNVPRAGCTAGRPTPRATPL
jgi:hypothetical protein